MTFTQKLTVTEIGEPRTSARGNEYLPVKLENGSENYSLAAMGNAGAATMEAGVGGEIEATFEIRQFGKEISLQLRNASVSLPF